MIKIENKMKNLLCLSVLFTMLSCGESQNTQNSSLRSLREFTGYLTEFRDNLDPESQYTVTDNTKTNAPIYYLQKCRECGRYVRRYVKITGIYMGMIKIAPNGVQLRYDRPTVRVTKVELLQ